MPDKVFIWRKHGHENGEGEEQNTFSRQPTEAEKNELNRKFGEPVPPGAPPKEPDAKKIVFADYNPTCVWTGTRWL